MKSKSSKLTAGGENKDNYKKSMGTIQRVVDIIGQLSKKAEPQKIYQVINDCEKTGPLCQACAEKTGADNSYIYEVEPDFWDIPQSCEKCECLLEYKLTEKGAKLELEHFLNKDTKIDLNSAKQCYEIMAVFQAHTNPKLLLNPKKTKPKSIKKLLKLCSKIKDTGIDRGNIMDIMEYNETIIKAEATLKNFTDIGVEEIQRLKELIKNCKYKIKVKEQQLLR
ncbi:MAG: hypothetical protein BWK75_01980 [Candidatus Altiarchaeales archaeon A3]|nr:MAG: hypothetical protein BWK75_01980 [Candidatus Altiarchaeales archaeon A3]